MKVFDSSDIRNVAVIGHGHCGKTSLTAAMLFTAGATDRLLKVDEGNTITDFDEEEATRKMSITSALAATAWQKSKINIIDTPGYNLFLSDTKSALIAADAALVLLDGVAGVEVSTEKVWSFAEELNLTCAFVVNKLDRDRASYSRIVEEIRDRFGRGAVMLQMPIGEEKSFNGVIDLIRMQSYCYKPGGDGKGKETSIPTPLEESAKQAHE
jgi:elongation factor G